MTYLANNTNLTYGPQQHENKYNWHIYIYTLSEQNVWETYEIFHVKYDSAKLKIFNKYGGKQINLICAKTFRIKQCVE